MLAGKSLTLVAAMAKNRGIGIGGKMPWHLPAELAHFKRLTLNHSVLMGRRTYESIGRPLPQRQNIVLTNNPYLRLPGCEIATSLEYALQIAHTDEVMVIGGGMLYRQALPHADRMVLTLVDCDIEADTFFPAWDAADWQQAGCTEVAADQRNAYAFSIVDLRRVSAEQPSAGQPPGPQD